jgi:hypothetical protein
MAPDRGDAVLLAYYGLLAAALHLLHTASDELLCERLRLRALRPVLSASFFVTLGVLLARLLQKLRAPPSNPS